MRKKGILFVRAGNTPLCILAGWMPNITVKKCVDYC